MNNITNEFYLNPPRGIDHPMLNSSDKVKYLYLQILTLLIDIDDLILDEEIDYLKKLAKILKLKNGTVGELIKFVQLPKTEVINETINIFFEKKGYTLMMDLILLSWSDNKFHSKEREFILKCSNLLGISLEILHILLKSVEALRKNNKDKLIFYLKKFKRMNGNKNEILYFFNNLLN